MLSHPSPALPSALAQELSLVALNSSKDEDAELLEGLCKEAIDALPEEAEKVRKGSMKVINTLVGRVMRNSRGRADARGVREKMAEMLGVK